MITWNTVPNENVADEVAKLYHELYPNRRDAYVGAYVNLIQKTASLLVFSTGTNYLIPNGMPKGTQIWHAQELEKYLRTGNI